MMNPSHNAFASYVKRACGDLLQRVAEATGVPLAVLDPHGDVLLATSDLRRLPSPGQDEQGEPLEASIETRLSSSADSSRSPTTRISGRCSARWPARSAVASTWSATWIT